LQRCGFKSSGVFTIDASKRDKRLNAYFGGFGATKKVVLFDTLIEKLSEDEILAVLGHELGHFKHGDILKGLALSFVLLGATFAVFGNLPGGVFGALGLNADGGATLVLYDVTTLYFEGEHEEELLARQTGRRHSGPPVSCHTSCRSRFRPIGSSPTRTLPAALGAAPTVAHRSPLLDLKDAWQLQMVATAG